MVTLHLCAFGPGLRWFYVVIHVNVFFITMIKEVDCKSRTHAPSMWIVFWIGAASTVAIIFIVVKSANYFLDSLLVWINAIQDSLKSLSLFFLTVKNLEIFHSQSLLQYYEYSMLYLFMVNTLYVVVISSFFFLSFRSWKHLVCSWVCSQVWISAPGNLWHR